MIVTALDNNAVMHEQLNALLRSLAINSPEDTVRVVMVGCSKEQEEEATKSHCEVEVISDVMPPVEDRRGYMVCYRAQAVLTAMTEQNDPVAWFDVDTVVRRSLSGFWENVGSDCLQIMCRENSEDRLYFQAGVFAVGNSDVTRGLVLEWAEKLSSLNCWYADQLWLRKLQKKHRGVRLVKMSSIYNNVGDSTKNEPFLEESVIWHCKGSHFNHPTFQKEFRKYRHG